jgi:ribonuclease HI
MLKPRVRIYCDGACSPNPGVGGWGVVLLSDAHAARRELSGAEPGTTNNRMELLGAIRGLEAIKRPALVDVSTDSQYVHHAFAQGWLERWKTNGWRTSDRKPVQNEDLWRNLLDLTAIHEVRWLWVRGHGVDVENNRADALAVQARIALATRLGRTLPEHPGTSRPLERGQD